MRVPEGWTQTTVGEVLERVADPVVVDPSKTYQEIGIRSHGKGLFDKEPVSGAVLGEKRVFWIQPDCFIVNIVFAWERAVGRTTFEDVGKIASHRFPMYRPKSGLADVDYLLHFFKTERGRELLALASPGGAGRNKTLGQKEFLKLPLCLPPLREQRRIAEVLSSVDEAIEATQAVIEQTARVRQGILNRLLTKGFGHVRFKQTEIGMIPEDWAVQPLGSVICGKPRNGKSPPPSNIPTEIMSFSIAAVRSGVVSVSRNTKCVEIDKADAEPFFVRNGDVLVVRGNANLDLVGTCGVVEGAPDNCLFPDLLIRITPNPALMDSNFLVASWNGEQVRDQVIHKAKSTNGTYKVSQSDISGILVPVPGMSEQKRIAEGILRISEVERAAISKLEGIINAKVALQSDLLTGRKRVTADALSPAA